MSNLDHDALSLCEFQGNLFEQSLEKTQCSSAVFLRRFMKSDVAKRMDRPGFLNSAEDIDSVFKDIDDQYGPSSYGTVKYNREELFWIGYIYRYWCLNKKISSLSAYKMIKPSELRTFYQAYHSLDPQQAIDRILESKNLLETEDPIERGVRVMREVMKRRGML